VRGRLHFERNANLRLRDRESTMIPILRTAYWRDLAARQAFKDFILRIHGVDFGEWDSAGYWDDDYSPYSYFVGDRVVASLCIYTMHARVNGRACKVAQVSGVGTLPEYRRQGLNRRLHEIALPEALSEHAFAFLYADDEAVPFYQNRGFRPVPACAVVVPLPEVEPDGAVEKLDLEDAAVLDSLFQLARTRAPVSQVFSTGNPKLVMYHLLYRLRNHAWRVPALDAVVLMKRGGATTVVYDILARELPRFGQLAPFLTAGGAREVEFRFAVDALDVPTWKLRELPGQNLHVMGEFDLGPQPVLTFTSQA
jgi:GNAT superfamily N-acetyltransferase